MEILKIAEVTEVAWWFIVSIITVAVSLLSIILAAFYDCDVIAIIFTIIGVIAVIVIIFAPSVIPTGEMSYTIEITDPSQYQILVEKGYSFERLFENKEIYTIIGDVLQ